MNEQKKFQIELCSDLDYEEMVADISYEDQPVAKITQDEGIDNIQVEIYSQKEEVSWKFSLDDFVEVMLRAKKCLINFQKISNE
jgi:hypothetical protein